MPATYYPAIIDRSASGFGATFPDFPGCIANGATINEAAMNAEAALALHVEGMIRDKQQLPPFSSLDDIEADANGADDVACVLIRVDAPAKVERVLISIDTGLLRAIDAVASNRSAWMADAARAMLHAEARGIQLPKQPIGPEPVRLAPKPRRPREAPPSVASLGERQR
jgi:predicted RNase H-like HicB family nuclease